MAFAIGIVLFALGIAVSIALHEAGHMYAARMTGMRVRRYFIGFGPTIWSTRRGHTEYGLKAVPLGGFCDIAGMTKLDEMTQEERPYAMYDRSTSARLFVMLGGIIMNVLLALVIIYGVALAWGLPDRSVVFSPTVATTQCTPPSQNPDGTLTPCSGPGPAAESGVRPGDTFVSVAGVPTPDFPALRDELRTLEVTGAGEPGGVEKTPGETLTVPAVIERDGREQRIDLKVEMVERLNTAGNPMTVGTIGMVPVRPDYRLLQYNPISAVGGTATFTGGMVKDTWNGLIALPQRFPGVVSAIFGGDRADDSPMSVVGASRVGGELVRYEQWMSFFLALASLNLFLAAFNLVPLPPLDGGHIAVVLYERVRDVIRKKRGLEPAGPADYTKLMPVTYAATMVLLVFGATVIIADFVNPVKIF